MGTRTVRLDDESEEMLATIRRATGLSISAALKAGLDALRDAPQAQGPNRMPFAVYRTIDLGLGGYARGRARGAKTETLLRLRAKTRR
jgi:hypothetical protein